MQYPLRSAILGVRTGLVVGRIDGVEILGIQIVLGNAEGVGEALIVNDLAGSKKFDGLPDIRVVGQTENVVIGGARFLLCYYHVFATKLSLAKARKSI